MDIDIEKLIQRENSIRSLPRIPKNCNSVQLFPVDLKLDGTVISLQNGSPRHSSIPGCATVGNTKTSPAEDGDLTPTAGIKALLRIYDLKQHGPENADTLHGLMEDGNIISLEGNVPADASEASTRVESAILGSILTHCADKRHLLTSHSARVPFQTMFGKSEARWCRYVVQNKHSILKVFYRVHREKIMVKKLYGGQEWRVYIIRACTPEEVNQLFITVLSRGNVYSALLYTQMRSGQSLTHPQQYSQRLSNSPWKSPRRHVPYKQPDAKYQLETGGKAVKDKIKRSIGPAGLLLLAQTAIAGEPSPEDSQMPDPQWG